MAMKLISLNKFPRAVGAVKMISTKNATAAMSSTENEILIEDVGTTGVILLNRPKALNALNLSMVKKIYPVLQKWESTKNLVIIKATGDKAFCAGGDVKSVVQNIQQQNDSTSGQDFFRHEYTLNHLIGTYKKPYIAIINGITMGGGVGLSVHGKYRIATEKTLFAMPETAIGLFPDVGGSYFLPRLQGKLGLFLGLTGYRLKGIDVSLAGIATHFIPLNNLEAVTQSLLSDNSNIDAILNPYLSKNIKEEFSLSPYINIINECFSAPTIEDITSRLKANKSEWAQKIVETLYKMSPTSLKITLQAFKKGSKLNLADCLEMEFRLVNGCLHKNSDFVEGVRALLIDKDQNPIWNPKALSDVTNNYVEQIFAPLPPQTELRLSKL